MNKLKVLPNILLNIYKYYNDEFDDINKVLAQYQKEKELINLDPLIKKSHYAYKGDVIEEDLQKINKIDLDVKTFWTAWKDVRNNLIEILEECKKKQYDVELQSLLHSMINFMNNAYEDYGILKNEVVPIYGSLPKIKNIIEYLRNTMLYYMDELKKYGINNEYQTNYYLDELLSKEGFNDTFHKFEYYLQLELPMYNYEDIIETNSQIIK